MEKALTQQDFRLWNLPEPCATTRWNNSQFQKAMHLLQDDTLPSLRYTRENLSLLLRPSLGPNQDRCISEAEQQAARLSEHHRGQLRHMKLLSRTIQCTERMLAELSAQRHMESGLTLAAKPVMGDQRHCLLTNFNHTEHLPNAEFKSFTPKGVSGGIPLFATRDIYYKEEILAHYNEDRDTGRDYGQKDVVNGDEEDATTRWNNSKTRPTRCWLKLTKFAQTRNVFTVHSRQF